MTQVQIPQTSVRQVSMLQRLFQLADRMIVEYIYEVGRYQPMNDKSL